MRLEIGAGANREDGVVSLDISPKYSPDILGDIRSLYREDIPRSSGIDRLTPGCCEWIRASHVVEHIEWIHQFLLFRSLHSLLKSGGVLEVYTPNIEWAVRKFLDAIDNKVPLPDASNFFVNMFGDEGKPEMWLNYKLFSGCSPGDYHHCGYTPRTLWAVMSKTGFQVQLLSDGEILGAMGVKSD